MSCTAAQRQQQQHQLLCACVRVWVWASNGWRSFGARCRRFKSYWLRLSLCLCVSVSVHRCVCVFVCVSFLIATFFARTQFSSPALPLNVRPKCSAFGARLGLEVSKCNFAALSFSSYYQAAVSLFLFSFTFSPISFFISSFFAQWVETSLRPSLSLTVALALAPAAWALLI